MEREFRMSDKAPVGIKPLDGQAVISVSRRRFVQAAGVFGGSALTGGHAWAEKKVPRVWQLLFRGETEAEQGFRDYLRERNFNIDLTVRNINRDRSKLPAIVAEIRAAKPDLIYTWGTPNSIAVLGPFDAVDPAKHITDIPVVFTMVADPVGAKLAPKWDGTTRNATGTSNSVPLDAQIKAMASYRPVRKLGVIFNPAEPNSVANIASLKALQADLGFELMAMAVGLDVKQVPIPADVPQMVEKLAAAKVDWIYIGPDTFIGDQRGPLTAKAIESGVPVFTGTELEVRTSDALCGLVARYYTVGQFAADKAMQILRDGVHASKIPVERIKSFSLVINMRAAKALKLYPPMALLKYAELININA